MSQMTRKQRLSVNQEELKTASLKYQLSQEKLQAQADLLATQQAVGQARAKLEDLKSAQTLSLVDIVNAEVELESLIDGEKRLVRLIKELYPSK